MKTPKALILLSCLLIAATLSINSCKKQSKQAQLSVRLTDAPGDFQEVNVDIETVFIHLVSADSGQGGSWIELPTNGGIYDLLELQNSIDTSLVDTTDVPAGKITQIRLILGNENTVMVDSTLHDVYITNSHRQEIKIIGKMELVPGQKFEIVLDFDAEKSIHETGNGRYVMTPVIKIIEL